MMLSDLVHWGATPASVVARCRGQLVYLATPYSRRVIGPDGRWSAELNRGLAYESAFEAGRLVMLGQSVHAPILQSAMMCDVWAHQIEGLSRHPLGQQFPDPMDPEFWEAVNRAALFAAGAVVVPDLPLWHQSAGVLDEVHQTLRANRQVFFYASYREGVI